jgi:Cell Wall Hydrolase
MLSAGSPIRHLAVFFAFGLFAAIGSGPAQASPVASHEVRCLALIAYAEAAVDGRAGMEAVIRVVQNRVADARFPDDACAVAMQAGQFQPVSERPLLRRVLARPEAHPPEAAFGGKGRVDALALATAMRLAQRHAYSTWRDDPTGGALYFVNPYFMDAEKCPWFAGLKRTAAIGGHVFMTHYAQGEKRSGPALDCSIAGTGLVAAKEGGEAGRNSRQRVFLGALAEHGARVATATPSPATLLAWRRSGMPGEGRHQLEPLFEPGWFKAP